MSMHLPSILSKGLLEIDRHNEVIYISSKSNNSIILKIPYSDITSSDWGFIYEKYIGQKYEQEGFQVEHLGLKKGFLDGGMDLFIYKEDFKAYIQCKYSTNHKACLGKQKIEYILYKASSFLSKQYKDRKLNFWLVVPTLDMITEDLQSYFLSKNNVQYMVKLDIKEIPMFI